MPDRLIPDPTRPTEVARLELAKCAQDAPLDRVFALACELSAAALNVERVGVWLFIDDDRVLRCADLFERSKGTHSAGTVLHVADFPVYFRSLVIRKAVPAEVADARAEQLADMLDKRPLLDRRTEGFSQGERMKTALARALILVPGVLLLDEPLGALDAGLRRQLQIELRRLHRDVGLTFIAVTHDQEEAMTMSDRIAVMRDGRIEQLGTPQEIYDSPQTEFVARFLGRCSVIEGRVLSAAGGVVQVETAALGMVSAKGDAAPGATLRLALRPEALLLDPASPAKARVVDAVFTGNAVRLALVASDGTALELDLQRGTQVPAAGSETGLCVPPGAAILLLS